MQEQDTRTLFAPQGIRTIFDGALIPVTTRSGSVHHYRVKGFRLEDAATMADTGNTIIETLRTSPDSRGVYCVGAVVQGVPRRHLGLSSFFPRNWTRTQVMQAIAEAYASRKAISWQLVGNFFEGHTTEGIRVVLELDEQGLILDAMPKRTKLNPRLEAQYRIEQGLQKSSRLVCRQCHTAKVLICPNGHHSPLVGNDQLTPFRIQANRVSKLIFNSRTPPFVRALLNAWLNRLEHAVQVIFTRREIVELALPLMLQEAARLGLDVASPSAEPLLDALPFSIVTSGERGSAL